MNMKKILFTVALALVVVGFGWAAGQSESKKTELRVLWWGPEDRNKKTVEALEYYEQKNPEVAITAEYLGFEAYTDKLVTQIAAGAAPDVIQMPYQLVPDYVARNAIRPLNEYIPHVINLDTYAPEALTNVTLDGKVYGSPTGISASCIYYDIEVFKELGIEVPDKSWTWEDFRDIAQKIRDAKGNGYYGTFDAGGYRGGLDAFVRGRGKQFFTLDGEIGFSKQDLVDWLTFWNDMRKTGAAVPPEIQATWQDRIDMHMIVQGKAAMDFTFASVTFQPLVKTEVGILTLPQGPIDFGSGVESVNPWVISSNSKHPDEAAKLIEFLINDKDGAAILGHARGIPPSSIVRKELRPTASKHDQLRYEFFDLLGEVGTPGPNPPPPGGSEVQQRLLIETNEQVAFGRLSVNAAADRFFSEARRILGY